jgi:hypothetical protein
MTIEQKLKCLGVDVDSPVSDLVVYTIHVGASVKDSSIKPVVEGLANHISKKPASDLEIVLSDKEMLKPLQRVNQISQKKLETSKQEFLHNSRWNVSLDDAVRKVGYIGGAIGLMAGYLPSCELYSGVSELLHEMPKILIPFRAFLEVGSFAGLEYFAFQLGEGLFKNGAKAISQKMLKNTTLKILAYERVGEALETAKIIPYSHDTSDK